MRWRITKLVAPVAGLLVLAACADRGPIEPTDKPSLNHTTDPPPFDNLGHWTLCKVGTDASFDVAVNGGPATTVDLVDGECQDVALTPVGGGTVAVTVTELTDPAFTLDRIEVSKFSRQGTTSQTVTGTNTFSLTINADVQATVTFYNEPVEAAPGRMTGGGRQIEVGGLSITRGFTIHCDLVLSNNLEINWPDHKWHITKPLTSALCLDDPNIKQGSPPAPFDTFIGEGVGEYDGQPGSTVKFTFIDGGEPGSDVDQAGIQIWDAAGNLVLDVPLSFLTHGNIQAHYDQPHKNKPNKP